MFPSRFMPCATCGDSVERAESERHLCDPDRLLSFMMFGLRDEVAAFEQRFRDFLDTRTGSFEAWLAARNVRDA